VYSKYLNTFNDKLLTIALIKKASQVNTCEAFLLLTACHNDD
jgi:hypothetical protein